MPFRTLPAGYLEIGESAAEGAIRETWEEACAEVEVVSPFAQLDIPLIGQVSEELLFIYVEFLFFFQDFVHLVTKAFVFLWADLCNFPSKAEESPVFTRSRIIRMPTFCTWWYTVWFSGIFVNGSYFKIGMGFFQVLWPTTSIQLLDIILCLLWLQFAEDVKAGKLKFHYGTINKR